MAQETPEKQKLSNDEAEATPQAVEYATMDERVLALESDNAVLRQMLSRQPSPSQPSHAPVVDNTPTRKLQDDIVKGKALVKNEQEKRRGMEALLLEEKDQAEHELHKKDVEIRTLHTQLLHARQELQTTANKLQESEGVVGVLKKENFRLVQLLKANKVDETDKPPDYFSNNNVRAERIKKDVPSSKPFSQVLRSLSPMLKSSRSHTPTRAALNGNDPQKRPNGVTSSVASNDGSRQPSPNRWSRTPSPNRNTNTATATATNRYSLANPQRSRLTPPTSARGAAKKDFKTGSRVSWRGNQGIIRYIGPVHGIGEGQWVGLELSTEGAGEHNGTLNSVRYFSTQPKTAVFCRMQELSAPKDFEGKQQQQPNGTSAPPSPSARRSTSPNSNKTPPPKK